ncbi:MULTISPECIES: hypothetical protein [unclassified Bradyrhizobium]|uniref:hypothetical protein n=1 Tax=unclassified Bradyrhizobium TaxID=2631580 RepID=UPI0006888F09|nr:MULTISPECIES: hypothetical protein [unclassified Bradyrhizobium]MCP3462286.1 hypothetical protein [Bradyrhizobium sp. CCGUVB23]
MNLDEQHEIQLIGAGDDERAVLIEHDVGDTCRLSCTYRGRKIEANADDFFEALCLIRRQLEPEGFIPFCYGASLNVYPSGMARDMGRGLKAYRLTKGAHVHMTDLVEIFETGPDVIPASVDAQDAFWREWLATPRR